MLDCNVSFCDTGQNILHRDFEQTRTHFSKKTLIFQKKLKILKNAFFFFEKRSREIC